ncbi:MAG: thioredoxin family protein [Anaerolineae bacterium]|nr:thioredoxin family protein [Anaerolineae bacterium]
MNGKFGVRLVLLLGLVALIAAGCSALAAPDEMADTGISNDEGMADEPHDDDMDSSDMSDDEDMADEPHDDEMEDSNMADNDMSGDDDMDEMDSSEAVHPDRPSAPVPVSGDYRYDPPTVVGATGNPQFLEFFTGWCGVCSGMKPTVHALEAEYWGKVDFVYLDREANENREVVSTFGISSQPVFILIDADGNEIERWFGVVGAPTLREAFDDYLATANS